MDSSPILFTSHKHKCHSQ